MNWGGGGGGGEGALSHLPLLFFKSVYLHLVWENNRAVSVKQTSLCKDVYRAHDVGKRYGLC